MTMVRFLAAAGLIDLSDEQVAAYEERRRRGEAPGFAGVFWAGLKECWADPSTRNATAAATVAVAVVASARFWPPAETEYRRVVFTTAAEVVANQDTIRALQERVARLESAVSELSRDRNPAQ